MHPIDVSLFNPQAAFKDFKEKVAVAEAKSVEDQVVHDS